MSIRAYKSPLRAAAAAEKRSTLLTAAIDLLRERSISEFTLDAVATAAGVTRLTVYNHFGSRRGLLEAVLDQLAENGKLRRLPAALDHEDPVAALEALVDIFCDFWAGDPAVMRLHEAIALDAEFGELLRQRGELRRERLKALVSRLGPASTSACREAVDLIFTLTSCGVYQSLAATQSNTAARRIIKRSCLAAIDASKRKA